MKNFLCIIMVLVAIGGCKPKIPADIIQPDKMAKILYDIHLTDGYIATLTVQDSAKKVSAAFYKGIYQKFAIDSAFYTKSMNYYYDHPKDLGALYDDITAKLKKTKDSIEKVNTKKQLKAKKLFEAATAKKLKKTKDSLERVKIKNLPKTVVAKKIKKTKDSLERVKMKNLPKTLAAKKLKKDSADKVKIAKKRKADLAKKVK